MSTRFKCTKCRDWHDGLPDIGYDMPAYANEIPEAERANRLFLTSDLCVVDNEHFFIRCVLAVPIRGTGAEFGWGAWSSLSQKNFLRYQEHYDEDMSGWEPMFGYLSNRLPHYPDTLSLELSVQPQAARSSAPRSRRVRPLSLPRPARRHGAGTGAGDRRPVPPRLRRAGPI